MNWSRVSQPNIAETKVLGTRELLDDKPKVLKVALAFALGAAICTSGVATAEPPSCRAEKLNGLYVFSATGYTIVGGVAQPKAIVELIRFNGDGTLTSPGATRSLNGVITEIPPGGTGTYTLAPDCRGSLAFDGGPSFDIFASPSGDDLWMIQTNPNNVLQGNVTRLSP